MAIVPRARFGALVVMMFGGGFDVIAVYELRYALQQVHCLLIDIYKNEKN